MHGGFQFQKRHGQINWSVIGALNIDEIFFRCDVAKLQSAISELVFANLVPDDWGKIADNCLKLFKLWQMICEYMLFCQGEFLKELGARDEKIQDLKKKLEEVTNTERKKAEEVKELKKDIRHFRQVLKSYEHVLEKNLKSQHSRAWEEPKASPPKTQVSPPPSQPLSTSKLSPPQLQLSIGKLETQLAELRYFIKEEMLNQKREMFEKRKHDELSTEDRIMRQIDHLREEIISLKTAEKTQRVNAPVFAAVSPPRHLIPQQRLWDHTGFSTCPQPQPQQTNYGVDSNVGLGDLVDIKSPAQVRPEDPGLISELVEKEVKNVIGSYEENRKMISEQIKDAIQENLTEFVGSYQENLQEMVVDTIKKMEKVKSPEGKSLKQSEGDETNSNQNPASPATTSNFSSIARSSIPYVGESKENQFSISDVKKTKPDILTSRSEPPFSTSKVSKCLNDRPFSDATSKKEELNLGTTGRNQILRDALEKSENGSEQSFDADKVDIRPSSEYMVACSDHSKGISFKIRPQSEGDKEELVGTDRNPLHWLPGPKVQKNKNSLHSEKPALQSVELGVSDQKKKGSNIETSILYQSRSYVLKKGVHYKIQPKPLRSDGVLKYEAVTHLPAGLQVDPSTGVIHGTPTKVESPCHFTIRVSGLNTHQRSGMLTISIIDDEKSGMPPLAPKNEEENPKGLNLPYRATSRRLAIFSKPGERSRSVEPLAATTELNVNRPRSNSAPRATSKASPPKKQSSPNICGDLPTNNSSTISGCGHAENKGEITPPPAPPFAEVQSNVDIPEIAQSQQRNALSLTALTRLDDLDQPGQKLISEERNGRTEDNELSSSMFL